MLVGTDVILKANYAGELGPITHTDKLTVSVSEDDTNLVRVSTDLVGKSAVWVNIDELERMVDEMQKQRSIYNSKKTKAVTNG